jgi:hypothetical protein
MRLKRGENPARVVKLVNPQYVRGRKTSYAKVQVLFYILAVSKYNLWYIDFFLTSFYIYNFALLKAERQRKSAIRQANCVERVRFRRICNEMELHEDIKKITGGKSNEKDISDISHFYFLIHFFVTRHKWSLRI